jgi:hypothetical protein
MVRVPDDRGLALPFESDPGDEVELRILVERVDTDEAWVFPLTLGRTDDDRWLLPELTCYRDPDYCRTVAGGFQAPCAHTWYDITLDLDGLPPVTVRYLDDGTHEYCPWEGADCLELSMVQAIIQ